MYYKFEFIICILCLISIAFGIKGLSMEKKNKNDKEKVKEIIDFFKKSGKDGINSKDIPKDIIKTGYLIWMLKDKTLIRTKVKINFDLA